MSGPSKRTIAKWQNRVNEWVPVGTSQEEASRIIERHGFDVVIRNTAYLNYDKRTEGYVISVSLQFRDGKLVFQPETIVSSQAHF